MDYFEAFVDRIISSTKDPLTVLGRKKGWLKIKDPKYNVTFEYRDEPEMNDSLRKIHPQCFAFFRSFQSDLELTQTFNAVCPTLCPTETNHYVNVCSHINDAAEGYLVIETDYIDGEDCYLGDATFEEDEALVEGLCEQLHEEILKRPEYRLLHITGLLK